METRFNDNWRFHLENANEAPVRLTSYKNQEAGLYASRSFNDEAWERVTLPHDWVMYLAHSERANDSHGHFESSAVGMDQLVPGQAVNDRPSTRGWYRKHFFVPEEWLSRRIIVAFEGVFRDSRVYVNGQLIDRFESGYVGFECDLTDNLYYGGDNVLAVLADCEQPEGWWYEGGGIYRNVYLRVLDSLRIKRDSLRVHADMEGGFSFSLDVEDAESSGREARIDWALLDGSGAAALSGSERVRMNSLCAGSAEGASQLINPMRWSVDEPNLYRLRLKLIAEGAETDEYETNIGFRTFRFDPDKGFFLNGVPMKLKGACIHQDFAGVGTAVPDDLNEYKIRRLKEMGANAYRSSHNAPSPAIVDACDRLGMLLMDETRMFGSTPAALRDTLALVRRDRTHPCVLMWSIGNEEHSVQNTEVGARIAKRIVSAIRAEDPERVITYGGNNAGAYDGINAQVDVRGVNYIHLNGKPFTDEYHIAHPEQPMYCSEETSNLSVRGEYRKTARYTPAYGEYVMRWGSTAEGWWKYCMARDYLAGGFIWTGFDYFGEPTPYTRNTATSFGVIDLTGLPKDTYYYYAAWWKAEPCLHLFPHWNHEPGERVRVVAYTNQDEVELFLNGASLGRKPVERYGHAEWDVAFVPGTLEARAYTDGKMTLTARRETAGQPKAIRLSAEKAGTNGNTCLVRAEITDESGMTVPDASHRIAFAVKGGNARLIGVGNGDPASTEPDRFSDGLEKWELTDWFELADGEAREYNAFEPGSNAFYTRHDVPMRWVYSVPDNEFRDPARYDGAPLHQYDQGCRRFEIEFTPDRADYDRLLFGRVDGKYVIEHNGTEIARGEGFGLPCGCDIRLAPGRNTLSVTVEYRNAAAGGIFNGAWLARTKPAVWTRSAFHAYALALVQADGRFEISASADGLEPAHAEISL